MGSGNDGGDARGRRARSQRPQPDVRAPKGESEAKKDMKSGEQDGTPIDAGQADGSLADESEDMRWSRQQGLYGGSEYGGYIGNPEHPDRSPASKGPKEMQRTDDRKREEERETLERDSEASDVDGQVKGGKDEGARSRAPKSSKRGGRGAKE